MRKEALQSIRHRLGESPQFLVENLATILSALCPLFYDEEPSVRTLVQPLFKLIVESVSSGDIEPHFQLIVVHLTCGMTKVRQIY